MIAVSFIVRFLCSSYAEHKNIILVEFKLNKTIKSPIAASTAN